MKRFLWILCAFALIAPLSGCHGEKQPPEPSAPLTATTAAFTRPAGAPVFTKDNFPRLDGSTANIPLAVRLVQQLLELDENQAEMMVTFNTTPLAYQNLAEGACDLLIVYEASDETKAELAAAGADLDYIPLGLDALVFIKNEGNKIADLTVDQIVDIYSGKTTNWNTVGGSDMAIAAFQRDPTSGSQSLMKKLVMKDTPMMAAPTEQIPYGMGELIDILAQYDNEKNAIGYSVFYYANYMYTKPGLQFLAVEGVTPDNDSIRTGAYPLVNPFYVVLRADEPADSGARMLAGWLTGAQGQALVADAGYVPVH